MLSNTPTATAQPAQEEEAALSVPTFYHTSPRNRRCRRLGRSALLSLALITTLLWSACQRAYIAQVIALIVEPGNEFTPTRTYRVVQAHYALWHSYEYNTTTKEVVGYGALAVFSASRVCAVVALVCSACLSIFAIALCAVETVFEKQRCADDDLTVQMHGGVTVERRMREQQRRYDEMCQVLSITPESQALSPSLLSPDMPPLTASASALIPIDTALSAADPGARMAEQVESVDGGDDVADESAFAAAHHQRRHSVNSLPDVSTSEVRILPASQQQQQQRQQQQQQRESSVTIDIDTNEPTSPPFSALRDPAQGDPAATLMSSIVVGCVTDRNTQRFTLAQWPAPRSPLVLQSTGLGPAPGSTVRAASTTTLNMSNYLPNTPSVPVVTTEMFNEHVAATAEAEYRRLSIDRALNCVQLALIIALDVLGLVVAINLHTRVVPTLYGWTEDSIPWQDPSVERIQMRSCPVAALAVVSIIVTAALTVMIASGQFIGVRWYF